MQFKHLLLFNLFFSIYSISLSAQLKRPLEIDRDLRKDNHFERISSYSLGPTGAHGWMVVKKNMTHDARQILITQVEGGSPAFGILKEGDVILGVNKEVFKEDARKALAKAILQAQTQHQGVLKLIRWRPINHYKERKGIELEVDILLQASDRYSPQAPYNCKRSKKEMEDSLFRLHLLAQNNDYGRLEENLLAFMAIGGKKNMELVKAYLHKASWAKPNYKISLKNGGYITWSAGMRNLILIEYYQLSKDPYVLPSIREHSIKIAMGQSGGGLWGHGFAFTEHNQGKIHGRLKGYGAVNLAGLPCLLSLVLAEKLGIKHPEITLAKNKAIRFFKGFVDRGTIGYGYHRPGLDQDNAGKNALGANGKNALAALVFTHAGLSQEARYYSKHTLSLYNEHEFGHAGNSFQRFWGLLGIHVGGPKAVMAYQKETRWYRTLCRSWDGRVLFQKMGGWYGGATLNLDAANVLNYATTLKRLYITGKDFNPQDRLNSSEIQEAVKAGKWHWANTKHLSTDQLIEELKSWSPYAREWIAKHIAKRNEDCIPQLIQALESRDPNRRAGACSTLGYLKTTNPKAINKLFNALHDSNPIVQSSAAYAIANIGPQARMAIPHFIQAINRIREDSLLQPGLQALAYGLAAEKTYTAPLYMEGLLPQLSKEVLPFENTDAQALIQCIRKLLHSPSARVRACGVFMIQYLDNKRIGELAYDLYLTARYPAPDYVMFSGYTQAKSIDLMAKHGFLEGIDIAIDHLKYGKWGAKWRIPSYFQSFEVYAHLAREQLGKIKLWRPRLRHGENRYHLERAIAKIENDSIDRKSRTIKELLEDQFSRERSRLYHKHRQIELAKKWINNEHQDPLKSLVAIKSLLEHNRQDGLKECIKLLSLPPNPMQESILNWGSFLCHPNEIDFWKESFQISHSIFLKANILKVLGSVKQIEFILPYLDHKEHALRYAAIQSIQIANNITYLDSLLSHLDRNDLSSIERDFTEGAIAGLLDSTSPHAIFHDQDLQSINFMSKVRILNQMKHISATTLLIQLMQTAHSSQRKQIIKLSLNNPNPKLTAYILKYIPKLEDKDVKERVIKSCIVRVLRFHSQKKEALKLLGILGQLSTEERVKARIQQEVIWLYGLEKFDRQQQERYQN